MKSGHKDVIGWCRFCISYPDTNTQMHPVPGENQTGAQEKLNFHVFKNFNCMHSNF
jgi:hypothetical protein